jgi:hypothetical protein
MVSVDMPWHPQGLWTVGRVPEVPKQSVGCRECLSKLGACRLLYPCPADSNTLPASQHPV